MCRDTLNFLCLWRCLQGPALPASQGQRSEVFLWVLWRDGSAWRSNCTHPQCTTWSDHSGCAGLGGDPAAERDGFLGAVCNDRAVLGPWVNALWLNMVAAVIVGLLVVLSLILAATTLFTFTDAQANLLVASLLGLLAVTLAVMGIVALVQRLRKGPNPERAALLAMDKHTWQMPPLEELTRPVWSLSRKVGMLMLRVYLLIAVILLIVKVIQLATGH